MDCGTYQQAWSKWKKIDFLSKQSNGKKRTFLKEFVERIIFFKDSQERISWTQIETENYYRVSCDLPGAVMDSICISIYQDTIRVEAELISDEDSREYRFSPRIMVGSFALPHGIAGDRITAAYAGQTLELTLFKRPDWNQRRLISVRTDDYFFENNDLNENEFNIIDELPLSVLNRI
jgi:HSP20 family molecular chaperone IbpA